MPRLLLVRLCLAAYFFCAPAIAQEQQPAAKPAPDDQTAPQQQSDDQQQATGDQQTGKSDQQKPPSKLKKILKRAAPNCAHVGAAGGCWSESERAKEAKQKEEEAQQQADKQQPPLQPSQPAPRSSDTRPGESSSRDTQIDLSPPPGDAAEHEGADVSDVQEFHPYDPHRAMKNVEVGDFYFKRGNYVAAESRYEEALVWKPNDAIATFHLAETQEKLGKLNDALKNYRQYVSILRDGDYSEEARKAIARLTPKAQFQGGAPTSPPSEKHP